ncbi:hypothetical protein, partial [Stenotrophomonas maltophilia]|uniref:hypothetical protein n=1 Tax=Stenotrophomonas maltophilia TaxID=40324 RepID=UPI00209B609B
MSAPKPEPISHTVEMVIATVVGVGVGLGADNLLLGCVVGIGVGIVLSSRCAAGSAGRRFALVIGESIAAVDTDQV